MKLALCVLKLHVKHMHIYQCGSIFLQDGYVFAFIIIVVLFLCLVRPPSLGHLQTEVYSVHCRDLSNRRAGGCPGKVPNAPWQHRPDPQLVGVHVELWKC